MSTAKLTGYRKFTEFQTGQCSGQNPHTHAQNTVALRVGAHSARVIVSRRSHIAPLREGQGDALTLPTASIMAFVWALEI